MLVVRTGSSWVNSNRCIKCTDHHTLFIARTCQPLGNACDRAVIRLSRPACSLPRDGVTSGIASDGIAVTSFGGRVITCIHHCAAYASHQTDQLNTDAMSLGSDKSGPHDAVDRGTTDASGSCISGLWPPWCGPWPPRYSSSSASFCNARSRCSIDMRCSRSSSAPALARAPFPACTRLLATAGWRRAGASSRGGAPGAAGAVGTRGGGVGASSCRVMASACCCSSLSDCSASAMLRSFHSIRAERLMLSLSAGAGLWPGACSVAALPGVRSASWEPCSPSSLSEWSNFWALSATPPTGVAALEGVTWFAFPAAVDRSPAWRG
mmetsp:Transcript_45775/g.115753  ORF Transcript_45775/g.115753 Transcript_45775/m.115753 type:complete len:323 (-) Transcript_45775:452-1420(-)